MASLESSRLPPFSLPSRSSLFPAIAGKMKKKACRSTGSDDSQQYKDAKASCRYICSQNCPRLRLLNFHSLVKMASSQSCRMCERFRAIQLEAVHLRSQLQVCGRHFQELQYVPLIFAQATWYHFASQVAPLYFDFFQEPFSCLFIVQKQKI